MTHSGRRSAPCVLKRSPHNESKDMPRSNREKSFTSGCEQAGRADHGFPLPLVAYTDSHARPAVATRSVAVSRPSDHNRPVHRLLVPPPQGVVWIYPLLRALTERFTLLFTRIQRGGWCGLHCAHRATTVLSWGLCEHRDHASCLATPPPSSLVTSLGMGAD